MAGLPGTGSLPAATPGESYTNATGGLNFRDEASFKKYLMLADTCDVAQQTSTAYTASSVLMIYDRLCGVGSVAIGSTGTKTVATVALPRYTDGVGVQVWMFNRVNGTASVTLSINSYTDNDGNTAQAGPSITVPGVRDLGTWVPLPLAVGDKGVQAVASIDVTSAAGATATVDIMLIKPLAFMPVGVPGWSGTRAGNVAVNFLTDICAFARIYDGASIGICRKADSVSAVSVSAGTLACVYG